MKLITLKEFLTVAEASEIHDLQRGNSYLIVCPKINPDHLLSYVPCTSDCGNFCDIGKNPYWESCFSKYSGEWVSTEEVMVLKKEE